MLRGTDYFSYLLNVLATCLFTENELIISVATKKLIKLN